MERLNNICSLKGEQGTEIIVALIGGDSTVLYYKLQDFML